MLSDFSRPVRDWFGTNFGEPTAAQREAWPQIRAGDNVLLCAPTGSGKTLAAFLWAIDRLMARGSAQGAAREVGTRVVYVSPLRALAVDVEKNLRAPLRGISLAAERLEVDVAVPSVGLRTGDTTAAERRRLAREPPDILITTPESLYLMLTSAVRTTLTDVETVIVDEIHAVASTKRGSHLAVSLERLESLCTSPPQRIGLSATQRPLEEVAEFLGGYAPRSQGVSRRRPVQIVDAGMRKELDIEVVVTVDDLAHPEAEAVGAGPPRRSIWPSLHPRLLELIEAHHSTIVFVNARRLAERLASRLNELHMGGEARGAEAIGTSTAPNEELVRAHHGSLARSQRLLIEDQLKRGELRGLVATSSLELGIDMGAVDLVVQIGSPRSVSAGLQRIGRAGHHVGEPSSGRIFPRHRADLLECAVVVERMQEGLVESTRMVRNPLDVLSQQIVAACALDEWRVADLRDLIRRAAPFSGLSDELFDSVLDLLDGRYPSDEFAELRPRIVWDRIDGTVSGRAGAQRLAVTNAGTIPDRGLFGVFLPDGTRVGELDEEMVYESRVGETFLLGATTWRIDDITMDRVVVTPAPGQPARLPFWHGDGPGRPVELGRALGEFIRELRAMKRSDAFERLSHTHSLDRAAADNLIAYLDDQAGATGAVPDDRTIVIERFPDEIGDWRVCIHTPFGARVHAPWAIALRRRLSARFADDVEIMWGDDGIILRLPEAVDELDPADLVLDADEISDEVVAALPDTALFAGRFRECAARALLLPRRRVDRRTPLWQQRHRAANLLAVAARYPQFPILLETTRECVSDVFDLGALRSLMGDVASGEVRVVVAETPSASPFALSLLHAWIAVFMYEGDAPLAERRALALSLDRTLLGELLGEEELRSLVDPEALDALEAELQCLVATRRARDADELVDLCARLGPLSVDELAERTVPSLDVDAAVHDLVQQRRLFRVVQAGTQRVAAASDAARLRDALGLALPAGLPAAYTEAVAAPLTDLVLRYARTHVPFRAQDLASRLGCSLDAVGVILESLRADGRILSGEFRPTGVEREWCEPEVLRSLRRRTLARLRSEIEPVSQEAFVRFCVSWQGIGAGRRGEDALYEAVARLQGAPLVASSLESDVLAVRIADYSPAMLDTLCTSGDVTWVGAGSLGNSDGRVRLYTGAVSVDPDEQPGGPERPDGPLHEAIRERLSRAGASFWRDLVAAAPGHSDDEVLEALWDLVWSGEVTNDSLAPLRARLARGGSRARRGGARPRPGRLRVAGPAAAAGRWSLVEPSAGATPTAGGLARSEHLLDRYGVLSREMALAEGLRAGFAGVYPILRVLEERGQVRRGYFVAGLGAAQFARPGAVDRLRSYREPDREARAVVLASTDPAQPYGASLAWPLTDGRPSRSAGGVVVLFDGEAVALLDRGARLLTFPAAVAATGWVDALAELVRSARRARLEVRSIDAGPPSASSWHSSLLEAGFVEGYRGLVLRGR